MIKYITFHFAKPGVLREIYCLGDFEEAIKSAKWNLMFRHNVYLSAPCWATLDDGEEVVMALIDIPGNKAKDFKLGRHLKGISHALLKLDREKYEPLRVGKRLLFVNEITPNRDRVVRGTEE